jgi:hypothetical protein
MVRQGPPPTSERGRTVVTTRKKSGVSDWNETEIVKSMQVRIAPFFLRFRAGHAAMVDWTAPGETS